MKVVLATHTFLPRFIGGIPKHVFYLAKELTKFNYDVHILTGDVRGAPRVENLNGITVHRFPMFSLRLSAGVYYRIIPSFLPALIKEDPDLIHIHEYHHFTSDVSAFYARIKDKPLVFTIHGFYSWTFTTKFLSKLYDKSLGFFTLRNSKKLMCVSKSLVEEFLRKGAPADKITFIPNGICINDTLDFSRSDFNGFKERNDLLSNKVILAVGRLIKRKGFQVLIRAIPEILRRVPEAKIVIVGPDSGYKFELKRLTAELNAEKAILFTGVLSEQDVKVVYSVANVFVIPSLHESVPTTLLEAMCFGKPCVATSVGGIPDIIENERSGLLVKAGNHNSLANAIIKILQDDSFANYLGLNARKEVEKYDWSNIASHIRKVYEEVTRQ